MFGLTPSGRLRCALIKGVSYPSMRAVYTPLNIMVGGSVDKDCGKSEENDESSGEHEGKTEERDD